MSSLQLELFSSHHFTPSFSALELCRIVLQTKGVLFPLSQDLQQVCNERPLYWLVQYVLRAHVMGFICIHTNAKGLPYNPSWKQLWPEDCFEKNYWPSDEVYTYWNRFTNSWSEIIENFPQEDVKQFYTLIKKQLLPITISSQRLFIESVYQRHIEVVKAVKERLLQTVSQEEFKIPQDLLQDLNKEQKQAVEQALQGRLFILTGGPGTGKTFTLARIVELARRQGEHMRLAICAPTGKACQRIQLDPIFNHSQVDIMTVHRLLKIRKGSAFYHAHHPLPYHIVFVDETSMLDANMIYQLLLALDEKSILVLLGDPDQLPPVESGGYFHEFVDFFEKNFPKKIVSLTQSIRMNRPRISSLAQSITQGDWEGFSQELKLSKKEDGVELFPFDMLSTYLRKNFSNFACEKAELVSAWNALDDFRILCSFKKTFMGSEWVNARLLEYAISLHQDLLIPILVTKNQEELSLVNGQIVLVRIPKEDTYYKRWKHNMQDYPVYLERKSNKTIPLGLIENWDLGFALTIHKSQGSEYRRPCIIISPDAYIFGRSLLYTAWTRAKEGVDIFADFDALKKIFANEHVFYSSFSKDI